MLACPCRVVSKNSATCLPPTTFCCDLWVVVQANASALSLPSAGRQWEVIAALMQKAAFGDGGRGFVLEALAFVVNRGLGLLGR